MAEESHADDADFVDVDAGCSEHEIDRGREAVPVLLMCREVLAVFVRGVGDAEAEVGEFFERVASSSWNAVDCCGVFIGCEALLDVDVEVAHQNDLFGIDVPFDFVDQSLVAVVRLVTEIGVEHEEVVPLSDGEVGGARWCLWLL